jgi:membrane protease YdiL (CAAX protease family)
MNNLKSNKLLKTFLIFLIYFFFSYFFSSIIESFGLNKILLSFISDLIFLIFIIFWYKRDIIEDFKDLKKDYKLRRIFKIVIFWVVLIFVLNILMGLLTEMFIPNLSTDQNTSILYKIAQISLPYALFKAMIFGVVAEELLFRESISDVIKNNVMFVIVSSLLYTLMNFLYSDLTIEYVWIYILMYLLPSFLFSLAYVYNKNNILMLMLIKFVYNLFPITILIIESIR